MTFPDMTKIVPARKHGRAEVEHHRVTSHESAMSAFKPGMWCPEGTYACLRVGGQLVMSNTRHEEMTNYEVVREARGNVLIAGLGLGMILHPILAKSEVAHVTVVELEPDVITLIAPTLPIRGLNEPYGNGPANRWTIVQGDINTWRPPQGVRYDTIYFDIWPDICTDYYDEMKALVRAFRKYRNPGAWVRCWAVEEIRDRRKQEASYGW